MILLIIKGSPDQAHQAMLARDIPWNYSFARVGTTSQAHCQAESTSKIQAWFAETMLPPFTPGSLLFFSQASQAEVVSP